jgi:hypothetical protein
VSPDVESAGLKVPVTIVAGGPAAASEKVTFAFTASVPLPVSDKRMNLRPVGLTTRISTSPGKVCEKPVSVTVAADIEVGAPATVMFDGYGVLDPLSGIVIAAELLNVCPFDDVVPSWKV